MNVTRDPDSILSAWLDEGPTDLPDATRRAILTSLPTTPQARRGPFAPWRFAFMTSTTRLAAAALVAVVAIGGAIYLIGQRSGVGGPTPTPTATARPTSQSTAAPTSAPPAATLDVPLDTSLWTAFTSARNGASAKFPPGWDITGATASWIWQSQDPGPPANAIDTAEATDRRALEISSQKLPPGMSEDAWWSDYTAQGGPVPFCFPSSRSGYETVTVDGIVGYLHGGQVGCNFTEVIVVTGGRAYQLSAFVNVDVATQGVFSRPLFDAWLSTVHLDPASANDGPAPS
jgi:hypothetical protein